MKIAITPVVCVLEYFILDLKYTKILILSLLLVIFGVGLTTVKDFSTVSFFFEIVYYFKEF
jgi:hypothetical protein